MHLFILLIFLFSKVTLNQSKYKLHYTLQKISTSNKSLSFDLFHSLNNHKMLDGKTVNININKKCFLSSKSAY